MSAMAAAAALVLGRREADLEAGLEACIERAASAAICVLLNGYL